MKLEDFDKAIEYFNDLEIDSSISNGTEESREYKDNILIAIQATGRLKRYSEKNLEFLVEKGFRIHDSVKYGVSQKTVKLVGASAMMKDIYGTKDDYIQQILRVLMAYREIYKYEEQLEDFRKLRAVDEALNR